MKKALKNTLITFSVAAVLAVAVVFAGNMLSTMDSVIAMGDNISSSQIL